MDKLSKVYIPLLNTTLKM